VAPISKSEKRKYLEAVNRMRAKSRMCGFLSYYAAAKPLKWNDALYGAAYEHSADMAKSRKFSHKGSGSSSDWTARKQNLAKGSLLRERIKGNGYAKRKLIGENIAYGNYSLAQLMQLWVNSKGHCANIMNPKFTDFAMAKVHSHGSVYYWTQVFASSY